MKHLGRRRRRRGRDEQCNRRRAELAGALTVADLREGEVFEVRRVLAEGELGRRLVEMGLSSGARGAVARMAPFRGPVQIDLLGYSLSLRRSEAYGVVVERIDPS